MTENGLVESAVTLNWIGRVSSRVLSICSPLIICLPPFL